ncbi:NADPH-dependent FMN reductase [Roseicyclus marinus]|uniref:NADPH-dependent FMN reductase n=1 Tax=Roseicyclus marinus TaxID=2161673 RepID=UPI0024106DCF|nr:NAD(P)H-dependent oxidoreductase [Roseicyclus marinus]MDG3042567.1 NAD(P)H-dependent oxidoreductase [Roseicyclus marinus]
MSSLRLLGICGSLRAASWNRKLMLEAARIFDPAEFLDGNLRLPLYDGDLEAQGIPLEVQALADQIKSADAVVIVGPEYNKALSGVLKNALDWVSRVPGGVWRDKPVAIVSAAAGRAGGERSQMTMRHAMLPFRAHVLPGPEVFIAAPDKEFDDTGRLKNEMPVKLLTELMGDLRKAASR